MTKCPDCGAWLTADRLAGHRFYNHGATACGCGCGNAVSTPGAIFATTKCGEENRSEWRKAMQRLAELKALLDSIAAA